VSNILPGYTSEEIKKMQTRDSAISSFKQFWDTGSKPAKNERLHMKRSVKKLLKKWDFIVTKNEVLFLQSPDSLEGTIHRMLLPE
jgi:hypothetical protein